MGGLVGIYQIYGFESEIRDALTLYSNHLKALVS